MSKDLYKDLLWLPPPPADFSAQCRAILESSENLGEQIRHLAACRMNEVQLARLAKVIHGIRESGRSLDPLIPFRLAVVSNATTHFIVPALVASAARHGVALECIAADFGQVMQEVLSPHSPLNLAQPDAVLVAVDCRGLPLGPVPGATAAGSEAVGASLSILSKVRAGIKANSKALCILQTIARPAEAYFGSLDLVLPGTRRSVIDALNRAIADSISGSEDVLFDVAGLAETVGLANWHDPTLWNVAKLPFSSVFVPLYADHVGRLIAALRGLSRRCLVLDLDNTLWHGVIGDDGLEGIVIGQGDATGEAHLAVQACALALRNRGIVLAVSSKNDEDTARLPFREHPEMLLREGHIAVFQANWDDKASNIRAIARELSLGLDAMVFLDDSPAERELVRRLLPQVAVPELPADPALYVRTLLASGHFEAVTFLEEDRSRAEFYRNNSRRAVLREDADDLAAYLASLKMVMTIQPFDEAGRKRITQLINKSNQFNLTTRRYSEGEVRDMEGDPNWFTLQARLTDIFGDNGMISVVICRRVDQDWEVDSWLMSCRVIARGVENAILQEIVIEARQRGVRSIIGKYCPTARNKLVEDHYSKLGFRLIRSHEDGTTVWQLFCEDALNVSVPIEVRRVGAAWSRPAELGV
jgi:FkbH-like protein